MYKNIKKHIDLSQFPMKKNGHIAWKESVGLTVEFFYYNERHFLKILSYGNPSKDYVGIKIGKFNKRMC